jgi:hypothetical protein
MSVILKDRAKKYIMDWNVSDSSIDVLQFGYTQSGPTYSLQYEKTFKIGSGDTEPIWGSWYDTTSQYAPVAGTATPMYCDSGSGNGIRKVFGSNFEVDYSGTYNLQFSAQLDQASGSGEHIYIWFRKNGVDIPNSASEVALQGTTAESIPSWNYIFELNAEDYINVMYSVTNTNVHLKAVSSTPVVPAIPSVIITMWKL